MGVQEIALITSMFFLLASIYLFLESKIETRWIYTCFIIGWSAGVAFYVATLFFNFHGHNVSAILTIFQNGCFGTWLIITSFEKFSETERCKNMKTNLKTRIITWNLKSYLG